MRRFAEAIEQRRRRELYLMGVAFRCGAATADGWQKFEREFNPD